MSPRWLHWPAAVSAGQFWQVDALCGTKAGNDAEMALSSIVETGETANFNAYAFGPVRRSLTNTFIEFMISIQSGGAYSNAADFLSATSLRSYSVSVDGIELVATSVTEVDATSLLRIRFNNTSSTVIDDFWNDLDLGDSFVFRMEYQ